MTPAQPLSTAQLVLETDWPDAISSFACVMCQNYDGKIPVRHSHCHTRMIPPALPDAQFWVQHGVREAMCWCGIMEPWHGREAHEFSTTLPGDE
jgi:hypothetical protein